MRMLILGATGFLGKNLVREIQKVMPWVEITTHSRQSDSDITFDLTNAAAVNDFFTVCEYDFIINAFGHVPSKESSSKTFDSRLAVNAEGVVNLLNGLKFKRKRPFVIHFASALEPRTDTQESESIYVGLKALGTEKFRQALHKREILGTCLSIHNVYGPNQPKNRFVANCIIDLASGKNIFLEYPMRVRDFIFIEDFVEDVILILKLAMKSPSLIKHDYEIGTGEGNSILSVAGLIASFLGVGASRISYNSDYLDLNPVIVADTRNLFRQVSRTQIFSGISKTLEG